MTKHRAKKIKALAFEKKKSVYLSLVIPTYNEAKNIGPLLKELNRILNRVLAGRYELIVVDDNSPDLTWKKARAYQKIYPALKVYRRRRVRGLATAVVTGWQKSSGEILGVIDGDLQHPPATLLRMLKRLKKTQADLVVASRHVAHGNVSQWNPFRIAISKVATALAWCLLPKIAKRLSDPMSGYFLVKRSAVENCALQPLGYKILLEVTARAHVKSIEEVGYVFNERKRGASKLSLAVYIQYLLHLFRLKTK